MIASIITISDSAYQKTREDLSGPAVMNVLREHGFTVTGIDVVPDEHDRIQAALLASCDIAQVVVTTGGTGISARDVTPEATSALCERMIPGIAELMRSEGTKQTPMAPLSRGVCGTRGKTLLVNLPGNPQGAVFSLGAVIHLLSHAVDLLHGKTTHK